MIEFSRLKGPNAGKKNPTDFDDRKAIFFQDGRPGGVRGSIIANNFALGHPRNMILVAKNRFSGVGNPINQSPGPLSAHKWS